jgi:transcription-repair coupling factor (superfamily II helicase)
MFDRAPQKISSQALEIMGDDTPGVRFTVEPNRELAMELARARAEKADELLRPLVSRLRTVHDEGFRIALVSPSTASAERLKGLLKAYNVETELRREPGGAGLFDLPPGGRATIFLGPLGEGFTIGADGLVVIAEEEIFGARSHTRRPQAASRGKAFGDVTDFAQLQPGDYVVHSVNGVGLYKGLTKLPLRGSPIDFLHLEYEGGALYLPVYRLSEVQRYVGAEGTKPRLDRLGGVTWEKTKRKVSAEVRQLAEELLQLYAQRQALAGHAFPAPDEAFREF